MKKYYVYVFLREDRYTPYYVGKGSGNRCYSNVKRGNGRRVPSDKSRVVKIKENLTEEESFDLEKILILFWGRKDTGTGILYNRTDGGEGTSGYRHTEETKILCGMSMKGRKESEEHKKWRGELVSQSYKRKTKKEWEVEVQHRLNCSTQRKEIMYEGVLYRSLNQCSREMMKKYNLSRNTILRYIKEGRPLTDKKYNIEYKGTYTGTKYL
jgi:hypothetical protein